MVEWFKASSGVSDQQSVGSSPGRGTCVIEQDTLPLLLRPLDGTLCFFHKETKCFSE